MMIRTNNSAINELYNSWRRAETYACEVFSQVGEDSNHPSYIDANNKSESLLKQLLELKPSFAGVLAKIKIASYIEDFPSDVADPNCTYIAPGAVISAIHDLEELLDASRTAA